MKMVEPAVSATHQHLTENSRESVPRVEHRLKLIASGVQVTGHMPVGRWLDLSSSKRMMRMKTDLRPPPPLHFILLWYEAAAASIAFRSELYVGVQLWFDAFYRGRCCFSPSVPISVEYERLWVCVWKQLVVPSTQHCESYFLYPV